MPDTAARETALAAEVAALTREAAALAGPDTFARGAKAERRALALSKELARLEAARSAAAARRALRAPAALRTLATLALAAAALAGRAPGGVAAVPPGAAWPLERWLSFGAGRTAGAGAIGLLPWAALCQRAAAAAAGALLPAGRR